MSTLEQVKPAPVRTAPGGIRGWWDNSRTFLTEVRNETRRVTWPSKREVYATTLVVILTSTFFGLYLWGLDLVFDRLVNWVFRQFGA
jgi:preprotein translocase subunit SecE